MSGWPAHINAKRPAAPRPLRVWGLYALMLLAAAGLFLLIRAWGEGMSDESAAVEKISGASELVASKHTLGHVLLALAAVIFVGRLLGAALGRFGQPQVIGEVVAGILLGPSLLGRVSPDALTFLLPPDTAPLMQVLAQLGIILYMFLVGLELDAARLKSHAQVTVAISHASIVVPFLLGTALALALFRSYAPVGISFTSFALFMGAALSITAFPILARILRDRGLAQTDMGVLALSCAAADDVTAWCMLAFVVGAAQSEWLEAVRVCGLTLAYLGVMFGIVRPWLARRMKFRESQTKDVQPNDEQPAPSPHLAWLLVALLLSAAATEAIGIHAVFGAFVLGAILPPRALGQTGLARSLESLVTTLLLPAFFAYTGMRTEIGLLDSAADWLLCGAIILVATLGKFGGTLAAGRLTGLDWRTSSALGILMNTRGLMELIVLNIGLDLGVISPRLFAMMVIMAVVTTLATTPLLQLLEYVGGKPPRERAGGQ